MNVQRSVWSRRGGFLAAFCAAAALAGFGSSSARAACPSWGTELQPADGKTLLITGQHRDAIDQYVTGTGHRPGGMMVYTSLNTPTLGTLVPSNRNGFVQHMQYLMDKYPNTAMQIGLSLVDQLDLINLGLLDANISTLATILKNANRPIYLRIGYEFDAIHNAYDPAKYVTAYKRIVERLRQSGVTNVSFVWHSAATGNRYLGKPLTAWYPGDCYVDWAGVTLFQQPFPGGAMGHANGVADFADARDTPIMIAESTPKGRNTSTQSGDAIWNDWHQNVIDWINLRDVKVWSYINQNWNANPDFPGFGDSRIERNAALKQRWLAEIAKARYLSSSPTLYCGRLGWC